MLEDIVRILLKPVIDLQEDILSSVAQLQQQITEAKDSLQRAIARVEEDVNNLKQGLADRIDPAELEPISKGLSDLKAATDALDPDPDNPPTAPTDPEPTT